ncbi:hypothetical protein P3S67_022571 [Capsicum chacoense]
MNEYTLPDQHKDHDIAKPSKVYRKATSFKVLEQGAMVEEDAAKHIWHLLISHRTCLVLWNHNHSQTMTVSEVVVKKLTHKSKATSISQLSGSNALNHPNLALTH